MVSTMSDGWKFEQVKNPYGMQLTQSSKKLILSAFCERGI